MIKAVRRTGLFTSHIKKVALLSSLIVFLISSCLFLYRIFNGYAIGRPIITDSDYTLFPVLYKDIFITRAPFFWKFSSQLFLFPEFPLYIATRLFFPNPIISQYVSGIINILLTVLLIYLINKLARLKKFSLSIIFVAFGFLLASIETNPILSYIFANVNYYGAFLYSLLGIAFVIYISKTEINLTKKSISLGIIYGLGVLATVVSDPLYIIIFYAGLVIFLGIAAYTKYLSKQKILFIFFINTVPVIMALLARKLLVKYIGTGLSSYISIRKIPHAALSLTRQALGLPLLEKIELAIIFIIILVAFSKLLYIIKSKKRLNLLLFASLASIFPITNLVLVTLSGNDLLRYLLPTLLYPLIFFPFIINMKSKARIIMSALIILLTLLVFVTTKYTNVLGEIKSQMSCIQSNLDSENINQGVADYWDARALQEYLTDIKIVQIDTDFTPYHWLNNSYDYINTKPQFVILGPDNAISFKVNPIQYLGAPEKTYQCNDKTIYIYKNNNKLLNLFKGYDPTTAK